MKILLSCFLLCAACATTAQIEKISNADIHRLLYLGDDIYTGAAPEGAKTFAALAELGVTTVVCVDSARPDVELAAQYGLSYIHIPINYDAVDEHAQLSVKRMMQENQQDVFYIHCHHGKHRGPAVAAIALRQRSHCSASRALQVLETAGTSSDYPGLWRDVRGWMDSDETDLPELFAVTPVESFAGSMAKLDRNWDRIKLLYKNDWQVPASHPDLVVLNEAAQTRDLLTDCAQELPAELIDDADFIKRIERAVAHADNFYRALENEKSDAVNLNYKELKSSCVNCHRKYRND
ncbi:MAG: protein tyrosine phosphatase (PTP) superfamily phosphohydrolase (DUF442 family) [Myxococcota bacterium]|jgi:protein tyrosine phosphatase (PTP) superfamily phosphohydrolase (DUF442 family)